MIMEVVKSPGDPTPVALSRQGMFSPISVQSVDPAAGVEPIFTVPANKTWLIRSLHAPLTTNATVANRRPHLVIDDGANIYYRRPSNVVTAASTTNAYVFATEAPAQAAIDGVIVEPMPFIRVPAGHRVRLLTTAIVAGDDYGTCRLAVEELDA